jgi:hypothetical protein
MNPFSSLSDFDLYLVREAGALASQNFSAPPKNFGGLIENWRARMDQWEQRW